MGVIVITLATSFALWITCKRWHYRRIIAISLGIYTGVYGLTVLFAHIGIGSNSYTVLLVEFIMSLARLLVLAGAATFLM